MTEIAEATPANATEALAARLFKATIDTLEIASVHLGGQLGYYRALADGGDATPGELAALTGTTERYAREWLEQQAVAGFLTVDAPNAAANERRYRLPAAHCAVFVDDEDLSYLTPLATLAIGVLSPMEALLQAYRTGGGVRYEDYGSDLRAAIGAINRPQFLHLLAGWLASIPGVDARLRAAPPARVADVGCGTAQSSIAIARAYPQVSVDAIDVDAASIETARANVVAAGLTDRVRPVVRDASEHDLGGRYDLVTIFEGLHDMPRPVDALIAARTMLADGGSVVIADEGVGDEFAAPGSDWDRYHYGWSVVSCLPGVMGDPRTAATGAVLRPATLRRFATEAGFREVETLTIKTDFWRFYRLLT